MVLVNDTSNVGDMSRVTKILDNPTGVSVCTNSDEQYSARNHGIETTSHYRRARGGNRTRDLRITSLLSIPVWRVLGTGLRWDEKDTPADVREVGPSVTPVVVSTGIDVPAGPISNRHYVVCVTPYVSPVIVRRSFGDGTECVKYFVGDSQALRALRVWCQSCFKR